MQTAKIRFPSRTFIFFCSFEFYLCFFSYGPAIFLTLIQKTTTTKRKQNQKVTLLDENFRNGGSVKTAIKRKNKTREQSECLWPC